MTTLCAAFPGTGKTYFYENNENILDSDSSKFDKSEFPDNYIKYIKDEYIKGKLFLNETRVICISSHKEVRDALVENDLWFTLIYPDRSLKDEYIERYTKRGNNEKFVELITTNWDDWITELENQTRCTHIVLQSGQFISDIKDRL